MKLWGGRFSEPTDDDLSRLNNSIEFDQRFYAEDIAGSIAYARALVGAGVITQAESETLVDGLKQVRAEFESGSFSFVESDEDIHSAVERRLTEIVGAVGGKLHTGRSRNDQVATDFRLWSINAIDETTALLCQLQEALIEQAEQHLDSLVPGYTHLQPAQPITIAHWLMSFFWMLQRDQERLTEAATRTAVLPLGSGALSGTPLNIDREALKNDLGLNSYSQNSLDAVSDRDFVAEFLFVLSMVGVHLSRLAEDIILYSNPAFGFIRLNDRYSTGSSLMPQKRNADPMELTRGKAGRLIGNLTGFLSTAKGLPSGYNKDLQEDKEALFDSVDTVTLLLPVITAIITSLDVDKARAKSLLTEDMLATELADYLVEKGMPFRQAHHVVGRLVKIASDKKVTLSKLSLNEFQEQTDFFEADIHEIFDFHKAVSKRKVAGGTAPEAVAVQIEEARKLLQGM